LEDLDTSGYYKFHRVNFWGIVVTDVLVMRNETTNEERMKDQPRHHSQHLL